MMNVELKVSSHLHAMVILVWEVAAAEIRRMTHLKNAKMPVKSWNGPIESLFPNHRSCFPKIMELRHAQTSQDFVSGRILWQKASQVRQAIAAGPLPSTMETGHVQLVVLKSLVVVPRSAIKRALQIFAELRLSTTVKVEDSASGAHRNLTQIAAIARIQALNPLGNVYPNTNHST
jgi:hypothetical protein